MWSGAISKIEKHGHWLRLIFQIFIYTQISFETTSHMKMKTHFWLNTIKRKIYILVKVPLL